MSSNNEPFFSVTPFAVLILCNIFQLQVCLACCICRFWCIANVQSAKIPSFTCATCSHIVELLFMSTVCFWALSWVLFFTNYRFAICFSVLNFNFLSVFIYCMCFLNLKVPDKRKIDDFFTDINSKFASYSEVKEQTNEEDVEINTSESFQPDSSIQPDSGIPISKPECTVKRRGTIRQQTLVGQNVTENIFRNIKSSIDEVD